jgi:hypothetical protein
MKKYKVDTTISAENETEAKAKKAALERLSPHLSAAEINSLANVLTNDPAKKELAKQYLGT